MTPPLKVFLFGSENNGWALDQDRELTRRALQRMAVPIEFVPLAEAEVVHAVWDASLDPLRLESGAAKIVICHVCTNVFKMLGDPGSLRRRDQVDLWVTQSGEAERTAARIGMRHFYVPYAYDADIFGPSGLTAPRRDELRGQLGILPGEFVVGNFMRDTLGLNLSCPKPEKGADLFLEMVGELRRRGVPVHVLLAGPRRHWLRQRLAQREIPATFVGQAVAGDDVDINVLPLREVAALYHLLDLCLITSRHEGGPRAILEAAASRIPLVSTPVGLAQDIVHSSCLYDSVDEGIEKVEQIARRGYAPGLLDLHARTVNERHVVEATSKRFGELYDEVRRLRAHRAPASASPAPFPVQPSARPRRATGSWLRRGVAALKRKPLPGMGIRICLWHEFRKPPYGGGNQFMLALSRGLAALGAEVVNNQLDDEVDVHICNATWFDPRLVEQLAANRRCRVIHRLDGLVHLARGVADRAIDDRAYEFNQRFASATVMQSAWCLEQALALGYHPVRPIIVHNACDPAVFFPPRHPHPGPRIRLIATSWSDNSNKGSGLYKMLEQHLDWDRYEFTFVGRTQERYDQIRHLPPMGSRKLADTLRQHDVYLTASRNEACSNALIEALACGLPALYLNDGGNPEVVGLGGLPFEGAADMLPQLLRLVRFRESFRRCICIGTLQDVAMRYLELAQQVMQL